MHKIYAQIRYDSYNNIQTMVLAKIKKGKIKP